MGRVTKKRVLHLAVSLREGDGGIASVSRSMVSALQEWPGVRCELRALESREGKWHFIGNFLLALIEHQPELILIDHIHLAPLAYLTAWFHRTPYVIVCHGKEMDEHMTWLRRRSLQGAALRLANSNFTANRLTNKFGLSFVPCLLGLEPALEKVAVKTQAPAPPTVLIVGRMDPGERYKGHDQLIEAFAEMKKNGVEARLVVVGGGNDRERLEQLARTKGVSDRILFTGWVETRKLAEYLGSCTVFAMPSKNEGFGLTYIEAMKFAKPVIASKLDGAVDIVQDGVTGYLVNPDDIAGLAQKLSELLSNSHRAHSMGEAGKRRYETFFTHFAFAKRFHNALCGLVLGKRTPTESSPKKAA